MIYKNKSFIIFLFIISQFLLCYCFNNNKTDNNELDQETLYIYEKNDYGWILYDKRITVNNSKLLCWIDSNNKDYIKIFSAHEIEGYILLSNSEKLSMNDDDKNKNIYFREITCSNELINGYILYQFNDPLCSNMIEWPVIFQKEDLPSFLKIDKDTFTYETKLYHSHIITKNKINECTYHGGKYVMVKDTLDMVNSKISWKIIILNIILFLLIFGPIFIIGELYILHTIISSIVATILTYILFYTYHLYINRNYAKCVFTLINNNKECYLQKNHNIGTLSNNFYDIFQENVYIFIIMRIIHIIIIFTCRRKKKKQ